MSGGTVHIERASTGVVTLVLDNQTHHNALNDTIVALLTNAFRTLAGDDTCKVIVLRGSGGVFCAGREIGDIQGLQAATSDEVSAAYGKLRELNEAIYFCPKPVLAVLQRFALGAGSMLAAWADIALAQDDCVMGYPEVKIGLPPTMSAVQLIRGVNRKVALDLLLTGRKILAPEAAAVGMITRCVPAAALDATVASTIEALLAASPQAISRTKRLIWDTEDSDYRSGVAAAVDAISVAVSTRPAREGIAAFLAKRRPSW